VRVIAIACLAVLAAGTVPARAGDLSLPTKAPPLAPTADWRGCYIGVNIGGAWTHEDYADPTTAPPTPLGSHGASGVLGGGQIGCDQQVDRWVFGVEGSFDPASLTGNHLSPEAGGGDIFATRIPWVAALTGRVGYTLQPNVLLYLKGGVAWKRDQETDTDVVTGPEGFANVTRSGGLIGGGLEYRFQRNWSAFLEGDNVSFGSRQITFTGLGGEEPFPITIKENMWMVLVGVNYRFTSF
jgi:outer membrane immunogenic protein